VKNKFAAGDDMELILPAGNRSFRLSELYDMHGQRMDEVPGGGYRVQIPLQGGDFEMGLLARKL
jgi:putative protease